jgi:competence protein ComEA
MPNSERTTEIQIDLNQADSEQLMLIDGIDSERARLIIAYREENGPFISWDDFEVVPGIGPVLCRKVRQVAIIGGDDLDLDESPEDRELEELIAIAELDREAAAAYDLAAYGLPSEEVRDQLTAFRDDHLRHVVDIGALLRTRGVDLPDETGRAEASAMADLAAAAVEMGTKATLLAMIGNERLTNGTYESALLAITDPDARALLERNFADDKRHLAWLQENRDRAFDIQPQASTS